LIEADILLIYPPFRKLNFVSSIPYLAAYAKKKGFTVDALDSPNLNLNISEIIKYVSDTKPKSIGVSIPFTPFAESGLKLIIDLNYFFPEIPLMAGGVHVTLCHEDFIDYAFVCLGDGEKALIKFLEWVKHPMRDNINLERVLDYPFEINKVETPDWDIVEWSKYRLTLPTGEKCFPIQTSRGCIYDCNFCASKILFKGKINFKTVEQIKSEISNSIKMFDCKSISFRDENFTLNKSRFKILCNYLKENKISWWAQTRANLMDRDIAKLAHESGCVGFGIGVEAGNPEVLKKIGKGITIEEAIEAFKVLKEEGLKSAALFIIGHPWDNRSTISETFELAHKLDPTYFGLMIATPFPGTDLRKEVLEQGIELSTSWGKYDTIRYQTFEPIGLPGIDLVKLRSRLELKWFLRKPSRILNNLEGKTFKGKLRFLKRLVGLYFEKRELII